MALTADAAGQALSDAGVVERIVAAVMEQKLPPGAKLPEGPLCAAFECSRTQIRRVLVVLAERGVVTLHMNRGAFVKRPNAGEARDVFEARRAIERSIVLSAAARADPTALKELRANVVAGATAEARRDLPQSIRLTGEFHIRLAEVAGNSVLAKFLEELVARTSLIIGLYGSRSVRSCAEAEHAALIEAVAERDGARAAELMDGHLRHIERALDIRDIAERRVDIRHVFGR
ncbi:MAG TPA: GntR family transcriptional regulator [Roseiarcus sp.]|nr:GntR family transcriptional regulator [Roseiarcus sp.]